MNEGSELITHYETMIFMKRRGFIKTAGLGFMSMALNSNAYSIVQNITRPSLRVPLGLDAHSLRSTRWDALRSIEFAGSKKLDSILFNTFRSFNSLEEPYLKTMKEALSSAGLRIFIGAGSISKRSAHFRANFGTPEVQISEGIRVAKAIGANVLTCRIGNITDRYTEGGIEAHMEDVVKVMRSMRQQLLDADVKIAFENHGDLRTDELISIIDGTGTDICGAMLDPGNSVWQMEDPMQQLETVGTRVLCTSVRDYMVWESEEGATFQWTALGQGMMDFEIYLKNMTKYCPGVPLHIETISNSPRPIPFLTNEFWEGYRNLRAEELVPFMKLIRKGHPIGAAMPPPGMDVREFEIQSQMEELEISIQYLRDNYL
jgi:3-oxoisoapionate decarboxylase